MESIASSSGEREANPVLAAKSQYWHLFTSDTTLCVHLCLETSSSGDASSPSRTPALTATVPTACLRPPQQRGCWPSHLHPLKAPTPWAHTNQRMGKKKTINVILGARFYVLISSEYGLGHKRFWIKVKLIPPSFRTWLSGKWKGSFPNIRITEHPWFLNLELITRIIQKQTKQL